MALSEIRKKVCKKFKVGQEINMRARDSKGNITGRYKAEIVKFYPYHVSCIVNKNIESFTYADMIVLTSKG